MRSVILAVFTLGAAFGVQAQNYFYTKHAAGNPPAANGEVLYTGDDLADEQTAPWTKLTGAFSGYSASVPLPFAFQFNGASVTHCKVASTGFITFDTAVSGLAPTSSGALPAAALPSKSVVLWGMQANGENDKVLVASLGTAPYRQFWIRFASFSTPGDTLDSYSYRAIVLEEGTQNIYLVNQYGGQANGNYNAPKHNLGVQANTSTAWVVSSGSIQFDANSKTTLDNSYYCFHPGSQFSVDLGIQAVALPLNVVTGAAASLQYSVYNNGSSTVDSFTLGYSINGAVAIRVRLANTNVKASRENQFTASAQLLSAAGSPGTKYTITCWVEAPNTGAESNTNNDTLSFSILSVQGVGSNRKLLVETATASWCDECPMLDRDLEDLRQKRGNDVIVVQHHSLDGMAGNGQELLDLYVENVPEFMLNRTPRSNKRSFVRSLMDSFVMENLNQKVPATVDVWNLALDQTTGTVTFRVSVRFVDYYQGELSVGGMVTENNVRGTGIAFTQNLNTRYSRDPNNWYYKFSSPILGYYHQKVAWDLPGGIWGISRNLTQYKPGDSITEVFSYTLPALMKKVNITTSPYLPVGEVIGQGKPADLGAIGFVAEHAQGSVILNAQSKALWDATTQVQEPQTAQYWNLYPNPANDWVYISNLKGGEKVELIQVDGRQVFEKQLSASETVATISVVDANLASGAYYLRVLKDGKLTDTKIVLIQR